MICTLTLAINYHRGGLVTIEVPKTEEKFLVVHEPNDILYAMPEIENEEGDLSFEDVDAKFSGNTLSALLEEMYFHYQ